MHDQGALCELSRQSVRAVLTFKHGLIHGSKPISRARLCYDVPITVFYAEHCGRRTSDI